MNRKMTRKEFYAARRKYREQKAAVTYWHHPYSGEDSDFYKFENKSAELVLHMINDSTPDEIKSCSQRWSIKYNIMQEWFRSRDRATVLYFMRHNSRSD